MALVPVVLVEGARNSRGLWEGTKQTNLTRIQSKTKAVIHRPKSSDGLWDSTGILGITCLIHHSKSEANQLSVKSMQNVVHKWMEIDPFS